MFQLGFDIPVCDDGILQRFIAYLAFEKFTLQMEEPLEPRSDEVEVLAEFAKPRGKAPFHVRIVVSSKHLKLGLPSFFLVGFFVTS